MINALAERSNVLSPRTSTLPARVTRPPGSEQPGGERLAVLRRARVVRAEGLEQVHELLSGFLVCLHPIEQSVQQDLYPLARNGYLLLGQPRLGSQLTA